MDEQNAVTRLLTRGVDTVYPSREALESVLRSGKKLTLYQGFDPTGAHLHIGHAVAMRKLRQFQDLGHQVIFLIGDFTATIGDPSGKSQGRPLLTREQVLKNAEDYQKNASKILRFDGDNPVRIQFNSTWLSTLTFADILSLATHFTVQQMIERDMFQERMKQHNEIGLHEFLYPLMVGYDSVALNVDLELGGTDQTFNMMAGRKLVSIMNHKEKFVMTVPLLTDARGVKIGKTEGNVIGLTDPPNEFYGKIMSLGDDAIIPCFRLLTDLPDGEIADIDAAMKAGSNPMQFKKRLAFMLTEQFNSADDARQAQEHFETLFQKRNATIAEIPEFRTDSSEWEVMDLVSANLPANTSASEVRRFITQGAVEYDGTRLTQPKEKLTIADGGVLKVGKKTFVKIRLNPSTNWR